MSQEDEGDKTAVLVAYGELMLAFQRIEYVLPVFRLDELPEAASLDDMLDQVEVWDRRPMGANLTALKSQAGWPDRLLEDLQSALRVRNRMAHEFLLEYVVLGAPNDAGEVTVAFLEAELAKAEALEARLDAHMKALGYPDVYELDGETEALIEGLRPNDWSP